MTGNRDSNWLSQGCLVLMRISGIPVEVHGCRHGLLWWLTRALGPPPGVVVHQGISQTDEAVTIESTRRTTRGTKMMSRCAPDYESSDELLAAHSGSALPVVPCVERSADLRAAR